MVKIDRYGDRSNIELDLHKSDARGHQLLGTWSSSNGLLSVDGGHSNQGKGLSNRAEPLVITTILVGLKPYMSSQALQSPELHFKSIGLVKKVMIPNRSDPFFVKSSLQTGIIFSTIAQV